MTTRPFSLRIAVVLVRTWTRIYTTGLPAVVRERRIAEIASDLWEQAHDPIDAPIASRAIVGRLLRGVPDDLGWRIVCGGVNRHAARWAVAAILAVAVLTSSIWIATVARRVPLPHAPAAPPLQRRVSYPPPPPPPPPPCNPPGIGRAPITPCTPY